MLVKVKSIFAIVNVVLIVSVKFCRTIFNECVNLNRSVSCQPPKKRFIERCVLSVLAYGKQPKNVSVVLDLTEEDFDRKMSPNDLVETDVSLAWRVLSVASTLGSKQTTVQLLQRFPPRNKNDMQEIYRRLQGTLMNCVEYVGELNKAGVCLRFFGDLRKLPENIQLLMAKIEAKTKLNTITIVNVTLGGAATHETAVAVSSLAHALGHKCLRSEDLTEEFVENFLANSLPPPSDIFIKSFDVITSCRTLTEFFPIRFLLQSFVYKLFLKDHLPDMAFLTYVKALLDYQEQERKNSKHTPAVRQDSRVKGLRNILSEIRQKEFISKQNQFRQEILEKTLRPANCFPLENGARRTPLQYRQSCNLEANISKADLE